MAWGKGGRHSRLPLGCLAATLPPATLLQPPPCPLLVPHCSAPLCTNALLYPLHPPLHAPPHGHSSWLVPTTSGPCCHPHTTPHPPTGAPGALPWRHKGPHLRARGPAPSLKVGADCWAPTTSLSPHLPLLPCLHCGSGAHACSGQAQALHMVQLGPLPAFASGSRTQPTACLTAGGGASPVPHAPL